MQRTPTLLLTVLLGYTTGCTTPPVDELSSEGESESEGEGEGEGESGETGDEPLPPACARLEVGVAQDCVPVEVVSVRTRDLSFERDGWTLHGTLWYPQVDNPDYLAPGAVIFHGSGPNGRDGLVAGGLGIAYAEPIAVYAGLAEQLAARGFAVFSYDKRSCFTEAKPECPRSIHEYPGDLDALLVDDFVEDGRAAIEALAAEPGVAQDIILIGHSQGATFVPTLLAQAQVTHGGVMLAGAMLPLPETIHGQLHDLADYIEANDPGNRAIDDLRMQGDEALAVLAAIADGTYPQPSYLGGSQDFWRSWMTLQAGLPTQIAAHGEPLAAYFGEFDFNIGPAHVEQLQTWIDAGLAHTQLRTYADLTHAFVHLTNEAPGHTSEFSSEVVEDLVNWAVANSPL